MGNCFSCKSLSPDNHAPHHLLQQELAASTTAESRRMPPRHSRPATNGETVATTKTTTTTVAAAEPTVVVRHVVAWQYNQLTASAVHRVQVTVADHSLQAMTLLHCFLTDSATVRALCDFLSRQCKSLQEVTLVRNSLQGPEHGLSASCLTQLVQAIQQDAVQLRRVVIGNEFVTGTAGETALTCLCRHPTIQSLEIVYRGGDATHVHLQGLVQGLASSTCRLRSLSLEGCELLNDARWNALVDALLSTTSTTTNTTPSSLSSSTSSSLQHLEVSAGNLTREACSGLIRLLRDNNTSLQTLDMHQCVFLANITETQAVQLGHVLAHENTVLQTLRFRDIHWGDTLAIPLFQALVTNCTLQELDVSTCTLSDPRAPTLPTTRGYQAFMQALPHIKVLQRLRLGMDFYFHYRSRDFVQAMQQAMQANLSIIDWMDGTAPGRRRYGYWSDVIPACMQRNGAWQTVQRMRYDYSEPNMFLPFSVWQTALVHMAAKPERQTALFCLVKTILLDPPSLARP